MSALTPVQHEHHSFGWHLKKEVTLGMIFSLIMLCGVLLAQWKANTDRILSLEVTLRLTLENQSRRDDLQDENAQRRSMEFARTLESIDKKLDTLTERMMGQNRG